MMAPLEGGCLCGAIRYRLDRAPTSVAYCHCRKCQKVSGAPAVAWASVPSAAFKVTQGKPASFESSSFAERDFCPGCGSTLPFRYKLADSEVDVAVATLDNPEACEPAYHVWTDSRLAWFDTYDTLPRHGEHGPDAPDRFL